MFATFYIHTKQRWAMLMKILFEPKSNSKGIKSYSYFSFSGYLFMKNGWHQRSKTSKIGLVIPKNLYQDTKSLKIRQTVQKLCPCKISGIRRKLCKLYRAITFEPFDEFSNFLCPSIGFWVCRVRFWYLFTSNFSHFSQTDTSRIKNSNNFLFPLSWILVQRKFS